MNKTDREIDRVLLDVILLDGEQDEAPDLSDMATRAKAILAKRDEERRRKGPAKVIALGRMKPTKAQTSASDRKVYAAVAERDQRCTVQTTAFGPCDGPLQIDHQWGRGKEPTREDNCRRLCKRHHDLKTDSNPNRALWLLDYAAHSRLLKHHVEAEKARRMMTLEIAQHPETAFACDPTRAIAREAAPAPAGNGGDQR